MSHGGANNERHSHGQMLLGGLGLFGVLLIIGVPLQAALLYAALLACPLMMVFMMGSGQGHGQPPASRDDSDQRGDQTHTH